MQAPSLPFAMTDPVTAPTYRDGLVSRVCRRMVFEARDEVFLRLFGHRAFVMTVAMAALFWALRTELAPTWLLGSLYFALWGYLVPPVILGLHNTMHRRFIKSPRVLGRVVPYAMSFFFGIPTGYMEHHIGMHHAEDNMEDDLSSTLRYRRDSFVHFLAYFFRFFFLIMIELPRYLVRKRRAALARRALLSEWAYDACAILALWLDLRFGFFAFALPYVFVRFMMMAGNWGQHAFINTARKNDGLSNSTTCINVAYNRRCFNDGYHAGHHLKMTRHWTEMPQDFLDNIALYAREGAIVFQGLDFFMVSFLLWTGRWRLLAKHFVSLDGKARSEAEIIALLKARVRPVTEWSTNTVAAVASAMAPQPNHDAAA